MKKLILPFLLLAFTQLLPAQEPPAAEEKPAAEQTPAAADQAVAEREAAFAAMLKNATLKGSWIPVRGGAVEKEKADGYEIARAEKVEGDTWHIVSKMKHQGREFEFPIPVTVKWAGDTAVMILDEVQAGRGNKYSARVMYHNDRYAGSWWSATQAGGLLSGAITRPKTKAE